MRSNFRGTVFDFFAVAVLYLSVSFSVFGINKLLYTERDTKEPVTLTTQIMDRDFRELLHVGDALYDTLTKRRVGYIEELSVFDTDEGIYFKISFTSEHPLKGDAIRSSSLWFRYTRV